MTATRLFYPAGLKSNATYVHSCRSQSLDRMLEELTEFASGDWAPSFTGSKSGAPEFQIEATDIQAVLGLMTDEELTADLSGTNVELFFRAAKAHALRYDEGAGEHMIYRLTSNAMAYWTQIQANQNDEARISLTVCASDNGTNEPLIQLPSQSIDVSALIANLFTLGPIKINGADVPGVQSMTWANNIEIEKVHESGSEYPTLLVAKQARPVIRVEGLDLEELDTIVTEVEGEELTDLVVYLRKRKQSRINFDDADTVHLKFSATAGTVKVLQTQGERGTDSIEIHLQRPTAGGDLFTVDTGEAIA
jgi:hypothetical protein